MAPHAATELAAHQLPGTKVYQKPPFFHAQHLDVLADPPLEKVVSVALLEAGQALREHAAGACLALGVSCTHASCQFTGKTAVDCYVLDSCCAESQGKDRQLRWHGSDSASSLPPIRPSAVVSRHVNLINWREQTRHIL